MPWENIGECGSGDLPEDRDWISHCYSMAVSYLKFIIEDVPEGCKIQVRWQDHDLGDYPTIAVFWDFPQSGPPWAFISRCQAILERFNDSVEWSSISPDAIAEDFEEDEEIEDEFEEDDWAEEP